MNAKKICALALSLGLSASCAPKSDARESVNLVGNGGFVKSTFSYVVNIVENAFYGALGYGVVRATNKLVPKYAGGYAYVWNGVKNIYYVVTDKVKGYIDEGVDFAINFAEQKFELEKKLGKNDEVNLVEAGDDSNSISNCY